MPCLSQGLNFRGRCLAGVRRGTLPPMRLCRAAALRALPCRLRGSRRWQLQRSLFEQLRASHNSTDSTVADAFISLSVLSPVLDRPRAQELPESGKCSDLGLPEENKWLKVYCKTSWAADGTHASPRGSCPKAGSFCDCLKLIGLWAKEDGRLRAWLQLPASYCGVL